MKIKVEGFTISIGLQKGRILVSPADADHSDDWLEAIKKEIGNSGPEVLLIDLSHPPELRIHDVVFFEARLERSDIADWNRFIHIHTKHRKLQIVPYVTRLDDKYNLLSDDRSGVDEIKKVEIADIPNIYPNKEFLTEIFWKRTKAQERIGLSNLLYWPITFLCMPAGLYANVLSLAYLIIFAAYLFHLPTWLSFGVLLLSFGALSRLPFLIRAALSKRMMLISLVMSITAVVIAVHNFGWQESLSNMIIGLGLGIAGQALLDRVLNEDLSQFIIEEPDDLDELHSESIPWIDNKKGTLWRLMNIRGRAVSPSAHFRIFLSYKRFDSKYPDYPSSEEEVKNVEKSLSEIETLEVFRDQNNVNKGDLWRDTTSEAFKFCGTFILLIPRGIARFKDGGRELKDLIKWMQIELFASALLKNGYHCAEIFALGEPEDVNTLRSVVLQRPGGHIVDGLLRNDNTWRYEDFDDFMAYMKRRSSRLGSNLIAGSGLTLMLLTTFGIIGLIVTFIITLMGFDTTSLLSISFVLLAAGSAGLSLKRIIEGVIIQRPNRQMMGLSFPRLIRLIQLLIIALTIGLWIRLGSDYSTSFCFGYILNVFLTTCWDLRADYVSIKRAVKAGWRP